MVNKKKKPNKKNVPPWERNKAKPATLQRLKNYSMTVLGSMDHTEAHLRHLMKLRYVDSDPFVDEVMEYLKHYDYLNDERFIKIFLQNELRENRSLAEIKKKMKAKMFSGELISTTLEEADIGGDTFEGNALALKRKWYGIAPVRDEKIKQRGVRRLAGRGFSFDIINKVLMDGGDE